LPTKLAFYKFLPVFILLFINTILVFGKTTTSKQELQNKGIDSVFIFQELAFEAASKNDAKTATYYIERYIQTTLDFHFIEHSSLYSIKDEKLYKDLKNKYIQRLEWSSMFYIYAGMIGFFIVLMFNIRKKKDRVANRLLSLFLFIHSFFIIHVGLHAMNYNYIYPHIQSMSTVFSFLYGPLLYFYFKRIKTGYTFQIKDLLHLLPTIILVILFVPLYILSEEEKLKIMLNVGVFPKNPYGVEIALGKMLSLVLYSFFTLKLYYSLIKKYTESNTSLLNWQKNIVFFHSFYAIFYCIYGTLLINQIFKGYMFHTQLIILSSIVLYIAYVAYTNPKVLLGFQLEESLEKYKNSGLTTLYSIELKNELVKLFEIEKIHRINNISLDDVSKRLETTRHNASQIINEHFDLNFFELINKFRIDEAMEIIKNDVSRKRNLIDIAYEVGFNNKVTFNKSFKKINSLTPSQYIKTLQ